MEQPAVPPAPSASTPPSSPAEQDRVLAAIAASIERLDELGLADELGRPTVEPASAFRWP